jgi:hypothetical protein
VSKLNEVFYLICINCTSIFALSVIIHTIYWQIYCRIYTLKVADVAG